MPHQLMQGDIMSDLVPVTPNDGQPLTKPARGIRCRPDGSGGALRIEVQEGVIRVTQIEPGERLGIPVLRVYATGTTATGLEAMI